MILSAQESSRTALLGRAAGGKGAPVPEHTGTRHATTDMHKRTARRGSSLSPPADKLPAWRLWLAACLASTQLHGHERHCKTRIRRHHRPRIVSQQAPQSPMAMPPRLPKSAPTRAPEPESAANPQTSTAPIARASERCDSQSPHRCDCQSQRCRNRLDEHSAATPRLQRAPQPPERALC